MCALDRSRIRSVIDAKRRKRAEKANGATVGYEALASGPSENVPIT
jgi:hypothetical protein